MTHIRDIFDNISLSVIQFLESHKGVTNVQFFEIGGVSNEDIQEWERDNSPYKLPNDFKNFLKISDGLLLRWNIKLNNEAIPLGNMHLNSLETVKKIKDNNVIAYSIDSSANDGHVAFVYPKHNKFSEPEVWFQDLSCEWFFVAKSFTEYYRLMIMHLGLPHWQYAFTKVGIDPISKVWFRFLCPDRLQIDLYHHQCLFSSPPSENDDPLSNVSHAKRVMNNLSDKKKPQFKYKPRPINFKKVNQAITRSQKAAAQENSDSGTASTTNSTNSSTTKKKKSRQESRKSYRSRTTAFR
mmetsp:Transcript_1640/g.2460  ORF Transcript_1640/g.2460 Transcript_1640/m.2460 type:complete len:296 (-) Transcript_1640:24-911(-)